MAASYPGAIYSVPTFGTNMSDAQTHTTWRTNMIDEMRAVQLELGTTPSGSFSTVAARFTDIEADLDLVEALVSSGEQGPDSAGPTSAATPLTVNTFTLSVPEAAGRVHAWGQMTINKSASGDRFQATLLIEGNAVAESTENNSGGHTTTTLNVSGSAAVDTVGGVAVTMQLTRVSGTGTATVGTTTPSSTLHAILIPTV